MVPLPVAKIGRTHNLTFQMPRCRRPIGPSRSMGLIEICCSSGSGGVVSP